MHKVTQSVMHRLEERYFRYGQVGSASLVSIAHGTNDAQKTMGVMTLALIASGHWTSTTSIPVWVKFSAATAIAAGTYLGGWRIIRTLGKGLVDITPRQGMSSDGATAAVLLSASHLGFALSTTHVATGSVLGGGLGRGTPVRWSTAGRMVTAWATTFPIAALMGALMWWVGDSVGGAWRCARGLPPPRGVLGLDLPQLAPGAGQRRQRQRLVGPRCRDHLARPTSTPPSRTPRTGPAHRSSRGPTGPARPVPPRSNGSGQTSPDAPATPDGDREPTQPTETKTH